MAILYGSESAVHIETGGQKHKIKLTWTDTWLKRHGIWQIVAAQDMPTEAKQAFESTRTSSAPTGAAPGPYWPQRHPVFRDLYV